MAALSPESRVYSPLDAGALYRRQGFQHCSADRRPGRTGPRPGRTRVRTAAGRQALTSRTFTWVGFLFVFGVFLSLAGRFAVLDPVEDAVLTATEPVQRALRDAVRPLADVLTDYGDRQQLADENTRLRAEVERLSADVARLRESEARAKTLEELLGVRDAFPDATFLTADVVSRSPAELRDVVAIDRGSSDGVREGMVVLSAGRTLVGVVTQVTSGHAWVRLVTDPDSAVSAVVQESRAAGVVVGTHEGAMEMQYVRQGMAVHEGDTVVTSSEGGKVPGGLVVGRVAAVASQEQDLFQRITVQPLATLSRLETVLVMTSFLPQIPVAPGSE